MFGFDFMQLLYFIPVILVSLSFHEFAHAFVSYKLGDPTAKQMGRLTLNPIRHLDPLGTIMMIVSSLSGMGFGWAKPVPINPRYYKNYKAGTMLVSLAGPVSNLLLAFISVFPALYLGFKYNIDAMDLLDKRAILFNICFVMFYSNVTLAVFNLLPVPPLDGSKILSGILPSRQYFKFMEYENYIGMGFLLLMLVFPTQFSAVLRMVTGPIRSLMLEIARPIVRLLL